MSILKLGILGLVLICPLFLFKTTFFYSISTTIHSSDEAFLEQEIFELKIFKFHSLVTKIDILSETPTEKEFEGLEEFKLFGMVLRKVPRRCVISKKKGGFAFECPSFKILDTFEVPYKAEILIEKKEDGLVLTENAQVSGACLPAFVVNHGARIVHEEMFGKMKEFMENKTNTVN